MSKQRILVTGGTGFLGSYILQELIDHGYSVRALRRTAKNISWIPSDIQTQIEWVDGDILDVVSLEEAMQDVQAVIHSAAIVSFRSSERKRMYQVNL